MLSILAATSCRDKLNKEKSICDHDNIKSHIFARYSFSQTKDSLLNYGRTNGLYVLFTKDVKPNEY